MSSENDPGGRPTSTAVPPGRSMASDPSNACGVAAVMSAACAPPICAVSSAPGLWFSAFTVTSAPCLRASASFDSSTSTAATCRPIARAYCTARWPTAPMPEITTHSPARAPVTLSALYAVTPAHRIGHTATGSVPGGMRAAYRVSTSMNSAKLPPNE